VGAVTAEAPALAIPHGWSIGTVKLRTDPGSRPRRHRDDHAESTRPVRPTQARQPFDAVEGAFAATATGLYHWPDGIEWARVVTPREHDAVSAGAAGDRRDHLHDDIHELYVVFLDESGSTVVTRPIVTLQTPGGPLRDHPALFLLGPFRGDEPASAALVQGESIAEFVEQLVSIYGTEGTFLQEGYSE
jgi:hypothetical protein